MRGEHNASDARPTLHLAGRTRARSLEIADPPQTMADVRNGSEADIEPLPQKILIGPAAKGRESTFARWNNE